METQLPPVPATSPTATENTKLLAIFSFIMAGLSALGVLFVGLHFMIMHAVFSNQEIWHKAMENQPAGAPRVDPSQFFPVLVVFYLFFGGLALALVVLNLVAGFSLLARRRWVFCIAVAVFNCLNIPLGTVLGVFTMVILFREAEKARFG